MRNKSKSTSGQLLQLPGRRGRAVLLRITDAQLEWLRRLLADGALGPGHARRIKIILLTVEGVGSAAIAERTGLSVPQVSRVRERFRRGGVDGLADRPRPGRGNGLPPALVQRILGMVASPPPPGAQRWSIGRLARPMGLSRSAVYKVLRAHGIAPYGHRSMSGGPAVTSR